MRRLAEWIGVEELKRPQVQQKLQKLREKGCMVDTFGTPCPATGPARALILMRCPVHGTSMTPACRKHAREVDGKVAGFCPKCRTQSEFGVVTL